MRKTDQGQKESLPPTNLIKVYNRFNLKLSQFINTYTSKGCTYDAAHEFNAAVMYLFLDLQKEIVALNIVDEDKSKAIIALWGKVLQTILY